MPFGMLGRQATPGPKVETMPRARVNPKTGKLYYPKTREQRERESVKRDAGGYVPEKAVRYPKKQDHANVVTVQTPQQRALTTGIVVWNKGQWSIVRTPRARVYDHLIGGYTGEWVENAIYIVRGDLRDGFKTNPTKTAKTRTKRWRLTADGNVTGEKVPAHVLEAARLYQAGMLTAKG
jgi:hypothetical protein